MYRKVCAQRKPTWGRVGRNVLGLGLRSTTGTARALTLSKIVLKSAVDCTESIIQIPFDGPYGTKSEKMACPLSALIEARFTDFSQEGKDYPDVSVLDKKFVSRVRTGNITWVCTFRLNPER